MLVIFNDIKYRDKSVVQKQFVVTNVYMVV